MFLIREVLLTKTVLYAFLVVVVVLLLWCCHVIHCVAMYIDIEIGFSQPALTVSEGDGTVTQVSVGILNGGTTEQSFTFLITYNDGSKYNNMW